MTIDYVLLNVFCLVPFEVVFCGAMFIAMMKIRFNLISLNTSLRKYKQIAKKVAATDNQVNLRPGEIHGRGSFGETPDTHSRQRSSSSPPVQCSLSGTRQLISSPIKTFT
jgi:hypothetical protein